MHGLLRPVSCCSIHVCMLKPHLMLPCGIVVVHNSCWLPCALACRGSSCRQGRFVKPVLPQLPANQVASLQAYRLLLHEHLKWHLQQEHRRGRGGVGLGQAFWVVLLWLTDKSTLMQCRNEASTVLPSVAKALPCMCWWAVTGRSPPDRVIPCRCQSKSAEQHCQWVQCWCHWHVLPALTGNGWPCCWSCPSNQEPCTARICRRIGMSNLQKGTATCNRAGRIQLNGALQSTFRSHTACHLLGDSMEEVKRKASQFAKCAVTESRAWLDGSFLNSGLVMDRSPQGTAMKQHPLAQEHLL